MQLNVGVLINIRKDKFYFSIKHQLDTNMAAYSKMKRQLTSFSLN